MSPGSLTSTHSSCPDLGAGAPAGVRCRRPTTVSAGCREGRGSGGKGVSWLRAPEHIWVESCPCTPPAPWTPQKQEGRWAIWPLAGSWVLWVRRGCSCLAKGSDASEARPVMGDTAVFCPGPSQSGRWAQGASEGRTAGLPPRLIVSFRQLGSPGVLPAGHWPQCRGHRKTSTHVGPLWLLNQSP